MRTTPYAYGSADDPLVKAGIPLDTTPGSTFGSVLFERCTPDQLETVNRLLAAEDLRYPYQDVDPDQGTSPGP